MSAGFGVLFGTFVGAYLSWLENLPLSLGLIFAVVTGPIFGAVMAHHYRRDTQKHSVPHWNDFRGGIDSP